MRTRTCTPFALVAVVCLLTLGCAQSPPKGPSEVGPSGAPSQSLLDGVYPVLATLGKASEIDPESPVFELATVPVPGSEEETAGTLRVVGRPLVLFRETPRFDFAFENDECTAIGFQNTDALRSYTRDHLGAKLAVVIDGKVISEHKIREAIETEQIRITCCTVGGGDHLYAHLERLKLASESN